MIALADMKAGLAWLDALSGVVGGTNPARILDVAKGATDFYAGLAPERAGEFEAIAYALDAIATAQYRALCLLALEDLRG